MARLKFLCDADRWSAGDERTQPVEGKQQVPGEGVGAALHR